MNILSNLIAGPAVSAFGWTLVHSVWQGTALMLIAIAAFYFLRKKSANTRYLTGVGFLLTQVLASVVTFIYCFPKTASTTTISNARQLVSSTALSASRKWAEISQDVPMTFKIQMWVSAHLHELVICWLIGSGILLLRFAGGWIFTERLRIQAKVVMDKEWRARFGVITAKMNISKSVEFRETAKIMTPMVIGAFSPVVLIPIGLLSGFSTKQVEAILAHELAHIRRNDYLINMLQSFLEVIFFFHPAIWWLSEKVRAEREHCCDDIALTVCEDKVSLAHALMKVAEWQSTPSLAMAFASKKPLLLHRVQRVLGLNPTPVRTFSFIPVMIFAIGLVMGLSAYAVAQKVEKEKAKKTAKHATAKIHKRDKAEVQEELNIVEPLEVAVAEDLDESHLVELNELEMDLNMNVNIDHDMSFSFSGNDTLTKQMQEINQRIQGMHGELRAYHAQLDELNLEREKYQFETERFQREIEKFELKKQRAAELRGDLMEKRSVVMQQDDKKTKISDVDLDKQLADFEQQIKAQEQIISDLNNQIANARKEAIKAEEPDRKLQRDVLAIHEKISAMGRSIGQETRSYQKLQDLEEPRIVEGNIVRSRAARPARITKSTPPPPPPTPAKVAKPAAAPKAPLPPKEK